MTLNRYAKRRDANHREIVDALRQAGCDVEDEDVSICDALAGRAGQTFMLEFKLPGYTDSDLKPRQKRLRSIWRGHYAIVSTIEEALRAVGL